MSADLGRDTFRKVTDKVTSLYLSLKKAPQHISSLIVEVNWKFQWEGRKLITIRCDEVEVLLLPTETGGTIRVRFANSNAFFAVGMATVAHIVKLLFIRSSSVINHHSLLLGLGL
jgi:hypothetical protein